MSCILLFPIHFWGSLFMSQEIVLNGVAVHIIYKFSIDGEVVIHHVDEQLIHYSCILLCSTLMKTLKLSEKEYIEVVFRPFSFSFNLAIELRSHWFVEKTCFCCVSIQCLNCQRKLITFLPWLFMPKKDSIGFQL